MFLAAQLPSLQAVAAAAAAASPQQQGCTAQSPLAQLASSLASGTPSNMVLPAGTPGGGAAAAAPPAAAAAAAQSAACSASPEDSATAKAKERRAEEVAAVLRARVSHAAQLQQQLQQLQLAKAASQLAHLAQRATATTTTTGKAHAAINAAQAPEPPTTLAVLAQPQQQPALPRTKANIGLGGILNAISNCVSMRTPSRNDAECTRRDRVVKQPPGPKMDREQVSEQQHGGKESRASSSTESSVRDPSNTRDHAQVDRRDEDGRP